MSDLILVKLQTSEEIIAKVVEDAGDHYILNKPRLCAMQQGQDENGKVGNFLVLLPWVMYAYDPTTKSEKDVKMYKSAIIGESVDVPKILEDEYLQTTSGIQLATLGK